MPDGAITSWEWGFKPLLTSLRIVAVLLVVAYHAGLIDHGYVGVDLFFVLSGFLMANVLLSAFADEQSAAATVFRFYARRLKRLMPAALITLAATAVAAKLWLPEFTHDEFFSSIRASALWFANWRFLGQELDYFAADLATNPFLHFWSLSIEEQFYLGFPLLVALVFFSISTGSESKNEASFAKRLLIAAVAVTVVVVIRNQLIDVTDSRYYFGTDTRLYQLSLGVSGGAAIRLFRTVPRIVGPAAIVSTLLLVVISVTGAGSLQATGLCAASLSLVAVFGCATARPAPLGLSHSFVVALGDLSYGVYLVHWPLIVILRARYAMSPLALLVIAIVVSYPVAYGLRRLIELPIQRAGLGGRAYPLALLGVAATLVLSFAIFEQRQPEPGRANEAPSLPILTEGSKAELDKIPANSDTFARQVRQDKKLIGSYRFQDCWKDNNECYESGEGDRSLVLVGNSFAGQILPHMERLALNSGLRFAPRIAPATTFIQNYCMQSCIDRQQALRPAIIAANPAVVIAYASDVAKPPDVDDLSSVVRETVDFYTETLGVNLIVLEPTPTEITMPGWDDSDRFCLDRVAFGAECDFEFDRTQFETNAVFAQLADENPKLAFVPLFDLFCDADSLCAAIQPTGYATYRFDGAHVSTFTWDYFEDELQRRISGTGLFDSGP